jgi:hypothetical protein
MGYSEMELIKHINIKHKKPHEHINGTIKCQDCEEQFSSRWNLMNHQKENHPSQSPCKYNLQNKCKFTAEVCWFKHTDSSEGSSEVISCYNCGNIFRNKSEMMIHRKKVHITVIRVCSNFKNNQCKFDDDKCWFLHGNPVECLYGSQCKNLIENKCALVHKVDNQVNKTDSVFWKDQTKKGPILMQ